MARVRRTGHDLEVRADINVTSLVDVAFTLLVIFIITAPILQGGVEVDLPDADVPPVTATDRPFTVSVRPDGTVFLEDRALSLEEFEEAFPQLAEAGDFEHVYIQGDSTASHGVMMRVIAAVAATGKPMALVAVPRERERRR